MFFRFLFSYSCNKVSISSNNISLKQCNLHSRAIAELKTVHLESQKLDCFLIFLCSCSCCKKMEETYHAHSLWKQLPRWYFVSKTLKIKNYPCHQFSIRCVDRKLPYRCTSVDPTRAHYSGAKIPLSVPQSVWTLKEQSLKCCTVYIKKLAGVFRSLFVLHTLSHIIFREKPSMKPCIGNSYDFNLS